MGKSLPKGRKLFSSKLIHLALPTQEEGLTVFTMLHQNDSDNKQQLSGNFCQNIKQSFSQCGIVPHCCHSKPIVILTHSFQNQRYLLTVDKKDRTLVIFAMLRLMQRVDCKSIIQFVRLLLRYKDIWCLLIQWHYECL